MRWFDLVDSHVHLTDYDSPMDLCVLVDQSCEAGVSMLVCNGTSDADWPLVKQLADADERVLPCFGLHPWFVGSRSERWLDVLDRYVAQNACGVGEIGLDRCAEDADQVAQEEVFRAQLELACKHRRPAMVHCVRAWGKLLDILKDGPVPLCGFLVHAYGGSADMVRPLADMGAYFSFSGSALYPHFKKVKDALAAVPRDRMLLETDSPNMLPPAQYRLRVVDSANAEPYNHPANLLPVLSGLAEVLGTSAEELREQISENARRFFGPIIELRKSDGVLLENNDQPR